jgi:hypothetical protein
MTNDHTGRITDAMPYIGPADTDRAAWFEAENARFKADAAALEPSELAYVQQHALGRPHLVDEPEPSDGATVGEARSGTAQTLWSQAW